MLSQLYIENIAVIRQATIDFQQGFHVFTGETGAGKTILISAINAVLGGRTFKEIIRTGETRATVSALFTEISEELCKKIEVLGYPLEDNQLLVQREIDLSGKGQCRLDGRPATAAMLREVCSLLIDIHGQHDNQELLSAEKHLGFLDSFGEYPQELAAYTAAYDKMCDCAARLDKLQMDESYKLQRMDILQFQIKEIGDAKLSDGEEERLVEQQKRIRNAERITESLGAVYTLLNGNGEEMRGVLEALEEVSTELDTAAKYLTEFGDTVKSSAMPTICWRSWAAVPAIRWRTLILTHASWMPSNLAWILSISLRRNMAILLQRFWNTSRESVKNINRWSLVMN